uniref:Uncharacterized protein n=1 Tax=Chromera velia CCMP2878 TaxID=1169474 RepID=A0A0G4HCA1_9ALVE|eukprot:Cvel_26033.t1-p1 / transcript=Cvel_26033.t1 / gene=Cvel_26033 / organism=Chromera_velia_CCMP2878 / gene_product=hypothetical protein / transcript_product=hypothetical protein / location=Cvel_scaffold3033:3325-3603(-) / protein_length=93 / sequence_SO=supercontig / SO=protein_coding / is_pseudo=false
MFSKHGTKKELRYVVPRTKEQRERAIRKWAESVLNDTAAPEDKAEEARAALCRLSIPLSKQPQPVPPSVPPPRNGDEPMNGIEDDRVPRDPIS